MPPTLGFVLVILGAIPVLLHIHVTWFFQVIKYALSMVNKCVYRWKQSCRVSNLHGPQIYEKKMQIGLYFLVCHIRHLQPHAGERLRVRLRRRGFRVGRVGGGGAAGGGRPLRAVGRGRRPLPLPAGRTRLCHRDRSPIGDG